jgi:L-ascorbate metabolism protein UlaG (beta-lactamase superfamily)
MLLSHLGHATVLLETAGARILIDPGAFSDAWHGLTDLDAVLVTHLHPDHLDPAHVPALLAANPGARVLAEPAALATIGVADPFTAGDVATVGDVTITGVGGTHALIHADLPRIGNTGMLLRAEGEPTFFHPGDAYEYAPAGVDVLALPTFAPWATLGFMIDFARAVGPARSFPIHDGVLSPAGRAIFVQQAAALAPGELVDLAGAGAVAF